MEQKASAGKKAEERTPEFKARMCMRFDDDVVALGNAFLKRCPGFTTTTHAVNASVRKALAPFAPAGFKVRIDPFEHAVFEGRAIVQRIARQRKARK